MAFLFLLFTYHCMQVLLLKFFTLILVTLLSCLHSFSQISVATDASLLRNFNEGQKFWAFGQTVQLNFHPSEKEAIYAWISYYTNGRFKNNFSAVAKDPATIPQQANYTVYTAMRFRQFSVGWKHYFFGSFDSENIWNAYGYAGFGLLLGKADNRYSQSVDTSLYSMESPAAGTGVFKRLTFDLGLGVEAPLGTGVFMYTELRTWIPTTHYPSPYLYKNNDRFPAAGAVNLGLRVVIQ